MAKDKISQDELKHDQFIDTVGSLVQMYSKHKSAIQWAAIAVAGAVLVFLLISQYYAGQSKKALRAFETASTVPAYNEFLEKYGSSKYVPLVLFSKGNALYNEKNYKASIESYQTIIGKYPKHPIADDAILSLGYCYMALNDYENAKNTFNKLITDYSKSEFINDARLNLVRSLIQLGDNEKADETARYMIDKEPNSLFTEEVKKLVPEIKRKM